MKTIVSEYPLVYTISNFLTAEECDHLISIGKNRFSRAVVASSSGFNAPSKIRTNDVAWIAHNFNKKTSDICKRISNEIDIPVANAEKLQLLQYKPETFYLPHCDAYKRDGSDKAKNCLGKGGQRMVTCLLYLNDVEEGGDTRFTLLNKSVSPEKGKMLIFHNCDEFGDVVPETRHEACKVIKGYKYAVNLWFREVGIHESFVFVPVKKYCQLLNTIYENVDNIDNLKKVFSLVSFKNDIQTTLIEKFKAFHKQNKYLFNINPNEMVSNRGFLLLKNVIPAELITDIQNYFNKCIDDNVFIFGDSQTMRYKCNNDIISRILQHELQEFINIYASKKVNSTYTYFSGYIKDHDLPSHTDNDKCEITASLVIGASNPEYVWPIYLEKNKNTGYRSGPKPKPHLSECREIRANVGDLMIFRGRHARHFREKLEIDYYNVTLMHYN